MTSSKEAEIFKKFQRVLSCASGEHVYDFIGAATRVSFKRGWGRHAAPKGREVRPNFPPKNEHYLDWVAVLTAVSRADGTFRMAELGAGWAPWIVRAALATRQCSGIEHTELLAVEADPTHHKWILEHFEDNGLVASKFHLILGAVGSSSEILRFPVINDPDVDYGASLEKAKKMADTIEVRGYTISELLDHFSGPLDLLHVDIQGAEYECVPTSMETLKLKVKTVMIGTHISDSLHYDLAKLFRLSGWQELINLPRNRTSATPWGEIDMNDGFLLFENPRFFETSVRHLT